MAGYRCSICGETWPLLDTFKRCPKCGRKSDFADNALPTVDTDEAFSIQRHVSFEKQYAIYDKHMDPERLQPTDEENERFTLARWREQVAKDNAERVREAARKERERADKAPSLRRRNGPAAA